MTSAFLPDRALWAQLAGEHAPDQMLVIEPSGRIVWANDRGADVFGWSVDELVGRSVFDLVHPDDRKLATANLSLLTAADSPPRPGRHRSLARDGSWIEVEVNASPPVDSGAPGLDRVLVLSVRRNSQHVGALLDALAGQRPLQEMMEVVLSTFRDPAYRSASVIRFHDSSGAVAVSDVELPIKLTGGSNGPIGRPAPWNLADPAVGPVAITDLDRLAPDVAQAARDHGFVGCVVQAIPDPAGYPPTCIVRWASMPGVVDVSRTWMPGEPAHLVSLVLQQRHRRELLEHAARHDVLTGLANRRQFVERLQSELTRRDRGGSSVALIYIDLDGFKQVNDQHGHGVGDALLRHLSERMRRAVRPTDLVARLGGDEFAIVCSDPEIANTAMHVVERVHAKLSQPFEVKGIRVQLGASIGIALDQEAGDDQLIELADRAMYQAKQRGKGGWVLSDGTLTIES